MQLNRFTVKDLGNLESFISPDRISTGISNLELHSIDQSHHDPVLPDVVIWPVNIREISKILKYSNTRRIPVTAWGSGSSLEGNPVPVQKGIVLDFSHMNRIIEIRGTDFQADVEPGVIYKDLNDKLRHTGLFFPPDPGASATIGGMIANNASGTKTVKYGSTRDNTLSLTVVLATGEIMKLGGRYLKTSSGYDLINMFIGSEGTLGIIAEATVRLKGLPECSAAAVATFPDILSPANAVFEIIRSGLDPAAMELLDPECVKLINKEKNKTLKPLPTLFMEFHGPKREQILETIQMANDICVTNNCLDYISGLEEKDDLLKTRHELGEMIRRNHPGRSHIAIDVAVPISAYPEIIAMAEKQSKRFDIPHYIFGHAGDGNIHLVFMGRPGDKKEWDNISKVNGIMIQKALESGGTSTGEHGTGIGKIPFMQAEHGNSLLWMQKVKDLFDPKGILNPGKILPLNGD